MSCYVAAAQRIILRYDLYDALTAFEQGNWLPLSVQAAELQLDEAVVSEVYLAAIERADQIMNAGSSHA